MAAAGILLLLYPALLVLVVALVLAAVRPQRPSAAAPGTRLAAVQRRTRSWRWGGVLAGLVLAGSALLLDDPLGRGPMLAAPLFALGVLAGVIGGELRVSAPAGPTRQVTLEVRRVRDYLPRGLTGVVVAASGLLALTLVFTTAMGSADDLGHAGRRLLWRCSEMASEGRGPWPGSFYSLPLAVLLVAGVAASVFALHRVVRRPRQGEDVRADDALRHQAATAVTAATGLLVAIPFAGISTFTAIALLGISCRPWWFGVLGAGYAVLVPVLLVVAIWCVVVLAAPPRALARVPAGR